MSILDSLGKSLGSFVTQTAGPFITETVTSAANRIVMAVETNPEVPIVVGIMTLAIINQASISRGILNGINACRHQWNKLFRHESPKEIVGEIPQHSSVGDILPHRLDGAKSDSQVSAMLVLNRSNSIADELFMALPPHLQKQEVLDALVKAKYYAPEVAEAIVSLPPHLQTDEIFNVLIKAKYNAPKVAQAIVSLPPHLQTDEIFNMLIKEEYYVLEIAQAIALLPKEFLKQEVFDALIDSAYNAPIVAQAIVSLPPELLKKEILDVLVKAQYNAPKLAQAIVSLPPHLQTHEIFNVLIKVEYNPLHIAQAIVLLPKEFLKQEVFDALINSAYNAPIVAQAIVSLPPELLKKEILDVLVKNYFYIQDLAEAIALLPKDLLKQEVFDVLIQAGGKAIEAALMLIRPKDVSDVPKVAVDESVLASKSSKMSKCVGRRPDSDGIGYLYEFEILPEYLNNNEAVEKVQIESYPAPEGPMTRACSHLPNLSSEGMWHLVRFIMKGEEDTSQSLFENAKIAEKRLVDQLAQFDNQANTPEAISLKRWHDTFKRSFLAWKFQHLGYSYIEKDGKWTAPDAEMLRHRLKELESPIEIGEVDGIVSDIEFLNTALTHDVVLGDFAHDQWIHVAAQIEKFFTEPSPGQYIQEREEMRSLVRSALKALSQEPDNQNQLCKLFQTVLGMYLDIATSINNCGEVQELNFQSLYENIVFDSLLANLYPKLSDPAYKAEYWNKEFLPFARNLVEKSIEDEGIRVRLLGMLHELPSGSGS